MDGWEEFDRRSAPVPTVAFITLQKKGMLSLNKAAVALLGEARSVTLLFNREQNLIGIRPSNEGDPRAYPVRTQGSGATHLIAGSAFTKFYGINTDVARRYKAEKIGDILAIDLKQDAPEVTGPRTRTPVESMENSASG